MSKTEPLTREELARLRAVAEAAQPGAWSWQMCDLNSEGYAAPILTIVPSFITAAADTKHVATFDPPTVLRLLDMVERLIRARSQR